MKTKARIALIALFFSVLAPLWGAQTASAASVYDNAYQSVTAVEVMGIGYGWTCPAEDVTATYGGAIASDPGIGGSFTTALGSGSWAVAQFNTGTSAPMSSEVRISWVETGNMSLLYNDTGGGSYETRLYAPAGQTIHQARIVSNFAGYVGAQSCDKIIQDLGTSSSVVFTDNHTFATAGVEKRGLIAANVNITYPDDYAGDLVGELATPATKYSPKFTMVVDKLKIKGMFCVTEKVCPWGGLGTNVGLSWEIYDEDGTTVLLEKDGKLLEGDIAQIDYEFAGLGNYTLKARYEVRVPNILPDDVVFETVEFPLNINGQTYATGTGTQNCDADGNCDTYAELEPCLTETFPFFDAEACIANVKIFANMLSFQTLSFGEEWTAPSGCHELTTLGSWMNLQNTTVCPMMPSVVRNTVTPFITLALGLLTVGFITRRSETSV